MADTKTELEMLCDVEMHEEHLCYMVSQGLHLSDPSAYEALINQPRFRCGHCHRTARSCRNLCVPLDLHPNPDLPSPR